MFRTNYFINFQRLTGQHIANCLFSVWLHKICDCNGMLPAMGSQVGEEDSSAFLKFSKTITFSRKSNHKKLRAFVWLCAFLRKQQRKTIWKKIRLYFKQARSWVGSPPKISFSPLENVLDIT